MRNRASVDKAHRYWKLDLGALIVLPIAATILTLLFKTNFLVSTFLFYVLPAIYLSFRTPNGIKRALLFSLVVSVPFFIGVDYVVTASRGWHVPTIFPMRMLSQAAFEDLFWIIALSYNVLIFYEHFLDKTPHRFIGSHLKYLMGLVIVLLGAFGLVYVLLPQLLVIPYAYFFTCFWIILIPTVAFLSKHPNFLVRFLKVGAYFSVVNILHELTSLELGHWIFPSHQFIGWVEILNHRFPLEEFIFFIILAVAAILSWFEYFDDDRHLLFKK